jgi:hypothetical protein
MRRLIFPSTSIALPAAIAVPMAAAIAHANARCDIVVPIMPAHAGGGH